MSRRLHNLLTYFNETSSVQDGFLFRHRTRGLNGKYRLIDETLNYYDRGLIEELRREVPTFDARFGDIDLRDEEIHEFLKSLNNREYEREYKEEEFVDPLVTIERAQQQLNRAREFLKENRTYRSIYRPHVAKLMSDEIIHTLTLHNKGLCVNHPIRGFHGIPAYVPEKKPMKPRRTYHYGYSYEDKFHDQ